MTLQHSLIDELLLKVLLSLPVMHLMPFKSETRKRGGGDPDRLRAFKTPPAVQ